MLPRDPLELRLLDMLAGKWIASALAAAAELGLADALADGPREVAALGESLGCQADALLRLLRVLSGEGVVEADPQGRYTLTEFGAGLKSGRLRDLARFIGADFMWRPWSALPEALRSGRAAFEISHGESLFEYLDHHAEEAAVYHGAVDAFTREEARALAKAFDFSGELRVVDVGGGLGTLLTELAAVWPGLSCVLFDRPNVIEAVRGRLVGSGASKRTELFAGDFFADALPEADVFVLKHVLHNWDDAHSQQLLEKCVSKLRPGGKVLIIEGILMPGNMREPTRLMDLEMLVLCGAGRERRKPEFRVLLQAAGLRLLHVHDLTGTTRLLVAEPH